MKRILKESLNELSIFYCCGWKLIGGILFIGNGCLCVWFDKSVVLEWFFVLNVNIFNSDYLYKGFSWIFIIEFVKK